MRSLKNVWYTRNLLTNYPKVFKELQRPDMQYTDVRKDQMDSVPGGEMEKENEDPSKGLMSRLGQGLPDSMIFFPARTPHAPAYTQDDGSPLSSHQGAPLNESVMQEPAQEPTPLSPLREANNGVLCAAAYQRHQVFFLCTHGRSDFSRSDVKMVQKKMMN